MDHLIEAVRKYPCLWNTTAIEYRDQELKDAAWTEVMKESNLSSVKEVKLKWKKLRDSYRDALKRQNDMLAKEPGTASKKSYPWKYMTLMRFLQPYMSNRKKAGEAANALAAAGAAAGSVGAAEPPRALNGTGAAGDRSSDESDSDHSSESKRKGCEQLTVIDRKLDYLCKAQSKRQFTESQYAERRRETPDPLDIFFNSMCQSTKRFPFPTQIKIKKVLFNAVMEAEEALVAEQQSYASLWAARAGSSSDSEADADADGDDHKPAAALS